MNDQQLELGFNQTLLQITVRRKRALKTQWWFEQMRNAVDSIDWRPSAAGRSQQLQLINGRRPSVA